MIYIGTKDVSSFYFGNKIVDKMYNGQDLVYDSTAYVLIRPTAKTGLVYNYNEQTVVNNFVTSTMQVVSGSVSQTNAGSGTVGIAPKPGFGWTNGTRETVYINWSIEKAESVINFTTITGNTINQKPKYMAYPFETNRYNEWRVSTNSSATSDMFQAYMSGSTNRLIITASHYALKNITITLSVSESTNFKSKSLSFTFNCNGYTVSEIEYIRFAIGYAYVYIVDADGYIQDAIICDSAQEMTAQGCNMSITNSNKTVHVGSNSRYHLGTLRGTFWVKFKDGEEIQIINYHGIDGTYDDTKTNLYALIEGGPSSYLSAKIYVGYSGTVNWRGFDYVFDTSMNAISSGGTTTRNVPSSSYLVSGYWTMLGLGPISNSNNVYIEFTPTWYINGSAVPSNVFNAAWE